MEQYKKFLKWAVIAIAIFVIFSIINPFVLIGAGKRGCNDYHFLLFYVYDYYFYDDSRDGKYCRRKKQRYDGTTLHFTHFGHGYCLRQIPIWRICLFYYHSIYKRIISCFTLFLLEGSTLFIFYRECGCFSFRLFRLFGWAIRK